MLIATDVYPTEIRNFSIYRGILIHGFLTSEMTTGRDGILNCPENVIPSN